MWNHRCRNIKNDTSLKNYWIFDFSIYMSYMRPEIIIVSMRFFLFFLSVGCFTHNCVHKLRTNQLPEATQCKVNRTDEREREANEYR
jgi:hypothetical protein